MLCCCANRDNKYPTCAQAKRKHLNPIQENILRAYGLRNKYFLSNLPKFCQKLCC